MSAARALRVACALIEHRGRILAARRGGSGPRAGRWEFPGGKLKPGESPAQCIVREIREELGIRVVPLFVRPVVRYCYPDLPIALIPVVCRIAGGRLRRSEHDAVRWLVPRRAVGLDWAEADFAVLERYVRDCAVTSPATGTATGRTN